MTIVLTLSLFIQRLGLSSITQEHGEYVKLFVIRYFYAQGVCSPQCALRMEDVESSGDPGGVFNLKDKYLPKSASTAG